jgi:hypothetical protein
MKIDGLPVIDVDESEEITVAVRADDLLEGDTANPDRHPSPSPYVGKTTVLQIAITPHSTWPNGRQIAPPNQRRHFRSER